MKKMIHEVEEQSGSKYQLWAEFTKCDVPVGMTKLEFSSVWTGAKNPKLEQNKGRFFFTEESLQNFKDLLNHE